MKARIVSLLMMPAISITLAATTAQARTAKSDSCQGPTNDVVLMALQDPDNQPSYVITIKNRAKEPIVVFSIGDGAKPELRVAPFAVPSDISAPAGWTGTHVFLEGSEFMHWVWSAGKGNAGIAPGELISGFKIVLPPFPQGAENTFYPDGTKVRPLRLHELPFRVHFSNGVCVWGHINRVSPENQKK